ncbi:MAG: hypothetical protein SFU25_08740, partial [Candidatus Caenarcaniphilales bacterium]|nr:hypothetical protein [Candidatus Caenarcaniphilales bacterium]
IDVVDEYAKPKNVALAKLFLYDYFMPPHDQVSPELIAECKEQNIGLISWSRGTLKKEREDLERLSRLYASLKPDQKPNLGVIVNLNYVETKTIFETAEKNKP